MLLQKVSTRFSHVPAYELASIPTAPRLREKLRMARVNKERALQLQERAALVAKEAEYERAFDEVRVCLFVGGGHVCACVCHRPCN